MYVFAPVFQRSLNAKMISVIHAGLTIGIAIVQKILFSDAPSSLADSRTESLTEVSINCFIRYSPRVEAKVGTMTAQ